MSKRRLIVKVSEGLFGMTQEARDEIKAKIRAWYDDGADPLVIPADWEVYGFTDEWEHDMAKYTTSDSLWELISEQQLLGWQVAAIGPCQMSYEDGHEQWVIFKRPKPLEGSDDEQD